jgi:predicted RNA methylase
MTKGDRLIVRAVNNAIAFPANRKNARHPSEKPTEVVSHFLRMLIDPHTNFLDPTCGSGTAVAAADSLGAKLVVGVELDREHAQTARGIINRQRLANIE